VFGAPSRQHSAVQSGKLLTSEIRLQAEADTQAFMASIAHLPAEAREIRLQRREWYRQLAERQGIADAEWRAEQYQRTGDGGYCE
jgi:hypothetical protein